MGCTPDQSWRSESASDAPQIKRRKNETLETGRKSRCFARNADQRTRQTIAHLNNNQGGKNRPPSAKNLRQRLKAMLVTERVYDQKRAPTPCNIRSLGASLKPACSELIRFVGPEGVGKTRQWIDL